MKKLCLISVLSVAICSSCAYMQSNKNITEAGVQYEGCSLKTTELGLYNKGSQWYIKANAQQYSKRYPLFHDSMLLTDNNAPHFKKSGHAEPVACYLPISAGTAATLQMENGYANVIDLQDEISRLLPERPIRYAHELRGGANHRIAAHIEQADTEEPAVLTFKQVNEPSTARRALATADFIFVDIPGTLAYNVAIPVMAPFVFFSEFLNEEN